jgi:hypothetical protein
MPLYVPAFPKVLIFSCFGIKLFYAILLWRATDYIQFIFLVTLMLIIHNSKNQLWSYPLWNFFPSFCCFILLCSNVLLYKALSCFFSLFYRAFWFIKFYSHQLMHFLGVLVDVRFCFLGTSKFHCFTVHKVHKLVWIKHCHVCSCISYLFIYCLFCKSR